MQYHSTYSLILTKENDHSNDSFLILGKVKSAWKESVSEKRDKYRCRTITKTEKFSGRENPLQKHKTKQLNLIIHNFINPPLGRWTQKINTMKIITAMVILGSLLVVEVTGELCRLKKCKYILFFILCIYIVKPSLRGRMLLLMMVKCTVFLFQARLEFPRAGVFVLTKVWTWFLQNWLRRLKSYHQVPLAKPWRLCKRTLLKIFSKYCTSV